MLMSYHYQDKDQDKQESHKTTHPSTHLAAKFKFFASQAAAFRENNKLKLGYKEICD